MTTDQEKQAYKEKLKSLNWSKSKKPIKKTVDHTDTAIVTTTEHWNDRQDTNVNLQKPVTIGARRVKENE
jgi:hypothetical protein